MLQCKEVQRKLTIHLLVDEYTRCLVKQVEIQALKPAHAGRSTKYMSVITNLAAVSLKT